MTYLISATYTLSSLKSFEYKLILTFILIDKFKFKKKIDNKKFFLNIFKQKNEFDKIVNYFITFFL